MNDAAGMRGADGVGNLNRELEQGVDVDAAALDARLQRLAFEPFHGDERRPLVASDFVDGADVRVGQRRGGARLAQQPILAFARRRRTGPQELQGDMAAEGRVLGEVDDTHPAGAELVDYAIVGDFLTDPQIQRSTAASRTPAAVRMACRISVGMALSIVRDATTVPARLTAAADASRRRSDRSLRRRSRCRRVVVQHHRGVDRVAGACAARADQQRLGPIGVSRGGSVIRGLPSHDGTC
jgi:hypothetical protein